MLLALDLLTECTRQAIQRRQPLHLGNIRLLQPLQPLLLLLQSLLLGLLGRGQLLYPLLQLVELL